LIVPDFALLHPGYSPVGTDQTNPRAKNALRERDFICSSLPGLTRQSMPNGSCLNFAAPFYVLQVSMDHRVEPGGDEVRSCAQID
jgi:hypothetical protein